MFMPVLALVHGYKEKLKIIMWQQSILCLQMRECSNCVVFSKLQRGVDENFVSITECENQYSSKIIVWYGILHNQLISP